MKSLIKSPTKQFVVYVDNIPTIYLEVNEDDTMEDVKFSLEPYIGKEQKREIDVFLNRETKLKKINDGTTLKSLWNELRSPSIFLNFKSYPVKPVYGYPKPIYEENFDLDY